MRCGAKRMDGSGSGTAGNADATTMNSGESDMTEIRLGRTKTGGHEEKTGFIRTAGLSGENWGIRSWEQQNACWERDAHRNANDFHCRLLGLRLTDASYTDRSAGTSANRPQLNAPAMN